MHALPEVAEPVANAVLFSDVKGFSKLRGKQVDIFQDEILEKMGQVFRKHRPVDSNTWGDAVFAIFSSPAAAAYCGLDLCHLFKHDISAHYEDILGNLAIRVSLHFGQLRRGPNSITGKTDYFGTNVNVAARVEPIVGPNQVWATRRFKDALEPEFENRVAVQRIGMRQLIKGSGSQELFRISWEAVSEAELKAGSYWNDPAFKVRGTHHISMAVRDLVVARLAG